MDQERTTFLQQLKAMLIRNATLKIRQRKKTITEIVMPIYILGILVFLRMIIPNPNFPKVDKPENEADLFRFFKYITTIGNFTIATAPNSTEVNTFLGEVNEMWNKSRNATSLHFLAFHSEEQLIKTYWNNSKLFHLGLVFEGGNPFNGSLKYNILTNPSWMKCPDTGQLYAPETSCRELPYYSQAGPFERNCDESTSAACIISDIQDDQMPDNCPAEAYYKSGLVALQMLIEFTRLKVSSSDKDVRIPNIILDILPKEAYTADWMVGFRVIIPLYMVMAVSQFINFLLILIVGEKEKKIKAGMKIVGLRDSVYWLSWFIIYIGFVFIISLMCTFMLCYLQFFQRTSYLLIFLLNFLYSISMIVAAFMMTPFFDKGKTAGVVGSFVVNIMSLLYFVQVFVGESHIVILWIISLASPAAFALAMDKALVLDLSGDGVTLETLWSGPGFTFGDSLIMMGVNIVLYSLVTVYLDSVWPSEFGIKRHPLFCCQFVKKFRSNSEAPSETNSLKMSNLPSADVEQVSEELKKNEAIRIVGLHKTFTACNRSQVNALNGIDLVIYENEITTVLGQNGAGKSTLFNILTGLTPPTSGTAYIYQKDIRDNKNMGEIQRMTGVCPQADILFENLTGREHLVFFARIKGVPGELLTSSVNKILQEVDIEEMGNSLIKTFSGGQKRKLSIGIAIIGDPKIIILDEPTAGVDTCSKRHIWSLLQKIKPSKVILLTTHFMEEADIVADRKAIICNGRLRCCGTSLFLKNRFGIGSRLMLELEDPSNFEHITEIVKRYVPMAKFSHTFGKEIYFILPNESIDLFAPLFYFIEDEIKSVNKNLTISSYALSMSSLEQVFLKLTNDESETCENEQVLSQCRKEICDSTTDDSGQPSKKATDKPLSVYVEYKPSSLRMLHALLRLRFLRLFRDSQQLICMIIFPLIFASSGFYINKVNSKNEQNRTSQLNQEMYPNMSRLAVNISHGVHAEPWISKLSEVVHVDLYNGSYPALLSMSPLLGAINITQCCQPNNLSLTVIYNDTMQHSLPIIVNLLNTAIFRMLVPDEFTNGSDLFLLETRPLPVTSQDQEFSMSVLVSSVFIGMTFVLLPISLVSDVVQDRENKTKHLLHVNGLRRGMYFMAYVIVLSLTLLTISLALLMLILCFNLTTIKDLPAFLMMGLIILLYSPAAILFIICISYFFHRLQTAQSVLPTIITWIGIIPFIVVAFLDMFGIAGRIAHVLMSMINIMYVPYAMFYYINKVHMQCDVELTCTQPSLTDYFTIETVAMLLGSLLQILLWSFVLRIVDSDKSARRNIHGINTVRNRNNQQDDANITKMDQNEHDELDVQAEKEKVLKLISDGQEKIPVAMVQNLTKQYNGSKSCCRCCCEGAVSMPKLAVHDLSFTVDRGEVFGLLGHNGAGKTTTIKIITGEEMPTNGCVWINGSNSSVSNEGLIGYCPQHDALWPNITVREHLEIFASIRGVLFSDLHRVVELYLQGLKMSEHADREVELCSGGTRRKLSYAIAMIGNTSLVILDEPSTGMDALSKRFLWNTIRNNFQGNRGAILTTHSMEEAETLCSRVGIITNGDLRCVGTIQYLKSRYGGGYILEMKLLPSTSKAEVEQFILSEFTGSTLKDNVIDRLVFNIPQQSVTSLAEVFYRIEQVKSELGILMYSFNQTNLEQVFLNLYTPDETSDLGPVEC